MKKVTSKSAFNFRVQQLCILMLLGLASSSVQGQWRYDSSPITLPNQEKYSRIAASPTSLRAYATTWEEIPIDPNDPNPVVGQNTYLRVSTSDGFPFTFDRKYSLRYQGIDITGVLDMQIANGKLYLYTHIGMLSMPVNVNLPSSPGVIQDPILFMENNTPPGENGFFHVPTGNNIAFAYIATPTGLLQRLEIGGSSNGPATIKTFASNIEITAITSGGGRLFVGTRNKSGNTNSEMINRYLLQSNGDISSFTPGTAFIFQGGVAQNPRQNVLSLAVVNGNRLLIGTQHGLYRVDDLAASLYSISINVGINHPLQVLLNSIMSSQINQMVVLGTKLYISSSSEGILYFPDATLTVMDVVYRYNEGFTRQSRKLVSGYSSGGPVLYTLDSDINSPSDILKSRAFDDNCFVTVSIAQLSNLCASGSRLTFNGNACGNLNLQYQWTGGVFFPNNTSASVLTNYSGAGASTVTLGVKSTDYGLNASFPYFIGFNTTTLNVPSVAPSSATSSTTRSYTLNLVFENGEYSTSCDLSGQQLNTSWTRGNGQKSVVIARIPGSPGIPGRLSLTYVAGVLADGSYNYGDYPINADNGSLVGYLVYKGTLSSASSNIPLNFPISVTGSVSDVGIRVFEINENTCGFSVLGSSNRPAPTTNTDFPCQTGRISRGDLNTEEEVNYYIFTSAGRIYLSSNANQSSISTFYLLDNKGRVKYEASNFTLNGILEIPYNSGVSEFLIGSVVDENGHSKTIKLFLE